MKKLTKEMIDWYIKHKGVKCPFCKSDQIEGTGDSTIDGTEFFNTAECLDCGERWEDVYILSDIAYNPEE